jgi:hypothetical protein
MSDDDLIWKVRAFIYAWFAKNATAPEINDVAQNFGILPQLAGDILVTLHDKHALFLEPGTTSIRMASPFSAIPSPFKTTIQAKSYWANCAWDSLGIVAALHAPDAVIDSICTATNDLIRIEVEASQVKDTAGQVVHFLVPFRRWYENLVET